MFGNRRIVKVLLLSAALLLSNAACQSGDGGAPTDRTTEDCSDACARVAAADCGDVGSECVDQCVHGPASSAAASMAGECASVESAYVNCFWSAAAYVCDEALGTLPVGCDHERNALEACSSSAGAAGAPDSAGAGGAQADAGAGGAGGEAAIGGAH